MTKKELFQFGIKTDNNNIAFIVENQMRLIICLLVASFQSTLWNMLLTGLYHCNFMPRMKEFLFGISNNVSTLNKKFNYTLLSLHYYIYECELNEDALLVPAFINKTQDKIWS